MSCFFRCNQMNGFLFLLSAVVTLSFNQSIFKRIEFSKVFRAIATFIVLFILYSYARMCVKLKQFSIWKLVVKETKTNEYY